MYTLKKYMGLYESESYRNNNRVRNFPCYVCILQYGSTAKDTHKTWKFLVLKY